MKKMFVLVTIMVMTMMFTASADDFVLPNELDLGPVEELFNKNAERGGELWNRFALYIRIDDIESVEPGMFYIVVYLTNNVSELGVPGAVGIYRADGEYFYGVYDYVLPELIDVNSKVKTIQNFIDAANVSFENDEIGVYAW